MEDTIKKKILEYLNEGDQIDILDPDGICSFIRFQDIIIRDSNIRFDFIYNPNGDEFEEVLSYKTENREILNSEGNISEKFMDNLYNNFTNFMIETYRDNW